MILLIKKKLRRNLKSMIKIKKYTKEDFIAKKHGSERGPWVKKQMPFPAKKLKSKEEEHYNKFCDWMKPLFLQIPLTDAIKLPPYSKYMKDIVSNKRKIPTGKFPLCLLIILSMERFQRSWETQVYQPFLAP